MHPVRKFMFKAENKNAVLKIPHLDRFSELYHIRFLAINLGKSHFHGKILPEHLEFVSAKVKPVWIGPLMYHTATPSLWAIQTLGLNIVKALSHHCHKKHSNLYLKTARSPYQWLPCQFTNPCE
jgi:hypothetical protein